MSRSLLPLGGLALAFLIAAAELATGAPPVQAALAFAIVVGYALLVFALQSRSDVASVLSGLPRDERWESINLRALALAAQLLAVALVGAFLVASFGHTDPMPYAWLGAVLALGYIGGIGWYRARS
jgi:hypothetical protein